MNRKTIELALNVAVIISVIGTAIYSHYDRKRSEKYVSDKIQQHREDVDYFIENAELFTNKVDTFFVKLHGLKN